MAEESRIPGIAERPPDGLAETLLAHARPKPALPALLVFFGFVLFPALSSAPGGSGDASTLMAWAVPAGIVVSCGLAIAAGFCSVFPTAIWIVLAGWGLRLVATGQLAAANGIWLGAGIGIAAVMFAVQVWRAATGRFQPMIRIEPPD